jgi:hypothetical protein
MEHLFLMFLDHTQQRNTVGRTPLDEWSARHRDLYLTTHDPHNRQISMPLVRFEPTISAGEWLQADHSSRGVLPTVLLRCVWSRNIKNRCSIYIYDISSLKVNVCFGTGCGPLVRQTVWWMDGWVNECVSWFEQFTKIIVTP